MDIVIYNIETKILYFFGRLPVLNIEYCLYLSFAYRYFKCICRSLLVNNQRKRSPDSDSESYLLRL